MEQQAYTTNQVTCGKGRKPSSVRRSQKSSSNGCRDKPFGKYIHHLQNVSTDLITK